jgi:hypothetical protein
LPSPAAAHLPTRIKPDERFPRIRVAGAIHSHRFYATAAFYAAGGDDERVADDFLLERGKLA